MGWRQAYSADFLQPNASQNEWAGLHDGRIRLRVIAPPDDDRANMECMKFIAKSLKTAKTNVYVFRGETTHIKTVTVLHPDHVCWKKVLTELALEKQNSSFKTSPAKQTYKTKLLINLNTC
jgi:uncharacterized protein YggU (UPF0235/DUF167 family)